MEKDPFKEYLKESEPDKAGKVYAWSTAVGLQDVDGLETSEYLIDTAIQNIEGNITLKEAQRLIDRYYEERPEEYISIHRRLFRGIYRHAGKIRDYNITKKEWVLDGATVLYGSASELKATLEYDFSQERNFCYKGLSMDEIIHHLAVFVSRLWQIHIFGEGNTRTTAVFFIKYLRTLGFSPTNGIFAENAWYFRNALVRANYTNLQKGIHETTEYLETFLKNLLLDEQNELRNRDMHISGLLKTEKVDIEKKKVDIDSEKVDIHFSSKTVAHMRRIFETFGKNGIFGRSAVVGLLGLRNSSASKLLAKLAGAGVIEPVGQLRKRKIQVFGRIFEIWGTVNVQSPFPQRCRRR